MCRNYLSPQRGIAREGLCPNACKRNYRNPIHPQAFSREGGAARPMKPLHCDLCGSGATAFPPWCAPPSSRAWAPRAGDASAPASGSALPPARAARNARAARFADRRGDGAEGEREYWRESGVPAAGWGQPTGRTPGPIRPILFACVLVGVLPGHTDTNGRKKGPPQGHSTFLLGRFVFFTFWWLGLKLGDLCRAGSWADRTNSFCSHVYQAPL